jgi:hypothetical protein
VQIDPIKPKLKAPGPQRLKLEFDGLLSDFAFNSTCATTPREQSSTDARGGDANTLRALAVVDTRVLNPRFLNYTASYDVASNIRLRDVEIQYCPPRHMHAF